MFRYGTMVNTAIEDFVYQQHEFNTGMGEAQIKCYVGSIRIESIAKM